MLFPKKVKYRKWQKARKDVTKVTADTRGTKLSYGSFGIKAQEGGLLKSNQLEAGRRAMVHSMTKTGKFWIRVFPDRPYTAKPPEVGMGKGKGDPQGFCLEIRPGRVIFEIDGMEEVAAKEALRKAGTKLPFKTKVVART